MQSVVVAADTAMADDGLTKRKVLASASSYLASLHAVPEVQGRTISFAELASVYGSAGLSASLAPADATGLWLMQVLGRSGRPQCVVLDLTSDTTVGLTSGTQLFRVDSREALAELCSAAMDRHWSFFFKVHPGRRPAALATCPLIALADARVF